MPRRRPPRIDPNWTKQHTIVRPLPLWVWLIIAVTPTALTGIAALIDRWL